MAPPASVTVNEIPASIRNGMRLASPAPGEEVVITGISGMLPDSDNVKEFAEKIFNKVDLVSDDDRRWKLDHPEIPQRTGKINHVSKFDAGFFGVHYKQAHAMDPMCRLILEKAVEAVIDSGHNPTHLKGNKTGVFVGACFSESEKTWFYEKLQVNGYGITGCSRAMLANRISYFLGLNGPSYTVDSACSSSLYALEHAYKAIRDGHCESALVGGCNLCLHPYVSLQFNRLGVLSPDGRCKSFDNAANGYARSEAVIIIFLQKSKDARRVYATVVHAKTNCDGYKEQGITYPSGQMQQRLLEEFYQECGIDPTTLGFVEAHGTGTKVGDPEELAALDKVFCTGRKEPLLIGSIKSSLGHSEPASGLCSVTKVIVGMESGYIPPNIHFNTPREGVLGFEEGRLKVVTEKTAWPGGLIGINSFGFGGANCHVLLKSNTKEKVNGGRPKDNWPRLVPVSGRTEEAIDTLLDDLQSRHTDVEYCKLLHEVHSDDIPGHRYRGYVVLDGKSKISEKKFFSGFDTPIWFVFSGLGSQWPGMATGLMKLPAFASSIQLCHQTLLSKGVELLKILTSTNPKTFENVLNCSVAVTAVQIALVDVLRTLRIVADNIIGHSIGELACAYADGSLTLQQTILAAYFRGLGALESDLTRGAMATVELSPKDTKELCDGDLEVAAHNGKKNCTVSGSVEAVTKFINLMKAKEVPVSEINCSGVPFHSRYITKAIPKIKKYIEQVIPKPQERSEKWISTSVPERDWGIHAAQYSSAEYFANSLAAPVLFAECLNRIPEDSLLIEISPNGVLQDALLSMLPRDAATVPLDRAGETEELDYFLSAIGKCYMAGAVPKVFNIYPEVEYPVSRGTSMIAPLIKWEHSEDWYVTSYRIQDKIKSGERTVSVNVNDEDQEYLTGHVIDGRNLFPATGYLELVWETVGLMRGELYSDISVVFEDVRFHRATNIPKDGNLAFIIMVQKASGNFEVVEGGAAIVTGRIYVPEDPDEELADLPPPEPVSEEELIPLQPRDIYKELRLRGYNYNGLFRSLIHIDNKGLTGRVAWHKNWVAFMDNMLQIEILHVDTRGLFVPTAIQKLTINVKAHNNILNSLPEPEEGNPVELDVYAIPEVELIRSGGVEARGLKASAITRRKPLGEPVLEKYLFIPHTLPVDKTMLEQKEAVRVCLHIAMEAVPQLKVKTIELVDTETHPDRGILSPAVAQILGDLPLIQADVSVLAPANHPLTQELPNNVSVEDKKLSAEQTSLVVIGTNVNNRTEVLQSMLGAVRDGGFIITRENIEAEVADGLEVCFDQVVGDERIILLRKNVEHKAEPIVLQITEKNFDWVEKLKEILKEENATSRVIVVSQGEPLNGIIGFINCIRKEPPSGDRVRGFFIIDENAPPFSLTEPLYAKQLAKDLATNVLKGGVWGSYRHLQLADNPTVKVAHAFVNVGVRGDLSTLKWLEGPLDLKKTKNIAHVYYSALNFRDIMTATGKLAAEVAAKGRINQQIVQGLEFSGRTTDGRRIMGMLPRACLSSLVEYDPCLVWSIPDEWSLEDVVTIPVVYGTAYYALKRAGRMQKGETALIHAGSGGVGQAAINICLHAGLTVYTTVGTPEKREFIKQRWPQLTDSHIFNSRDCSFEQDVMTATNGRGVDLVLNSLAEEKLLASVRCLARGGRFLEIGKFDLANNNPLGMEMFLKDTSFHGIMLDNMFEASMEEKMILHNLITEGLAEGGIIPLTRNVFNEDEVEQAFRYMAAGKHIGKVLIKLREEEEEKRLVPVPHLMEAAPRFSCDPSASYIICGGLGGFGLELADWMALRGARKLVLTSRTGLRTGYQALRIRLWRSYGCEVFVSTADITTEEGCKQLLEESNRLGTILAIFNLAVVLKDGLFENQNEEQFTTSFGPKAVATKHLDKLSRIMCPNLEHFVCFSSVSCGRGNAGQTNYGMSNSVMERICEKRVAEGLPGLAVQWGAIGEVGLVAEMQENHTEIVIGGTLQQRISSCLEVLDGFIRQSSPIVASMVVAEKRAGGGAGGNIVDTVVSILGLRDLKTVSLHSTLAELGMDSMMAVEIKQTLEREFEVFLTAQDIRSMTFAKLMEIAKNRENESGPIEGGSGDKVTDQVEGLKFIMRVIGNDTMYEAPVVTMQTLYDPESNKNVEPLFVLPGIEGMSAVVEPLVKNLKCPVYCIQMPYVQEDSVSLKELSARCVTYIKDRLAPGQQFRLLGYSFGGAIALESALILEKWGHEGEVILVDGAPAVMRGIARTQIKEDGDSHELQIKLLFGLMVLLKVIPSPKMRDDLMQITSFSDKMDYIIENTPEVPGFSKEHNKRAAFSFLNRTMAIANYQPPPKDVYIKSNIVLLRPNQVSFAHTDEDYALGEEWRNGGKVRVYYVDGDHNTMLDNPEAANIINAILGLTENVEDTLIKASIPQLVEETIEGSEEKSAEKKKEEQAATPEKTT